MILVRRDGGASRLLQRSTTFATCLFPCFSRTSMMVDMKKHIVNLILVVTCICIPRLTAAGEKPLVIPLWPGSAPDEPGTIGPEKVVMSPKLTRKEVEVTESTRMLTNVTKPTIT